MTTVRRMTTHDDIKDIVVNVARDGDVDRGLAIFDIICEQIEIARIDVPEGKSDVGSNCDCDYICRFGKLRV